MQARPLLIITTRLPPQVCGVGTFSWQLERHWPGDTESHRFLVFDGGTDSIAQSGNRSTSEFGRDWNVLHRALDQFGSGDVLFHYAGYGYQRFGCPTRFPGIFRKWKTKFPDARLYVFFHEVPGPPSIRSKRYLLDVCSRRVAGKIADLADAVITNTPEHAEVLQNLSRHRSIQSVPVPANVEPTGAIQSHRSRTEFVIFGLPFGRWRTLQEFDSDIRAWQNSGTLTKLHLIGPPDKKFDPRSEALLASYSKPEVVIRHGELSPGEISAILSHSRFAFTIATVGNWSKSGSLMAFLAHGCVVISKSISTNRALALAITPDQVTSLSDAELEAKAAASRQWYTENVDWNSLARSMADWIYPDEHR